MKIVYGEWLSYVGTYITCALGLYRIKSFTVIHTWSKEERKKKCYVYINKQLIKCFTAKKILHGVPF